MVDDNKSEEDLLEDIEEGEDDAKEASNLKEKDILGEPVETGKPEGKMPSSNMNMPRREQENVKKIPQRQTARRGQKKTALKAIRNMDVHLEFSLGQVTIPLSRLEKMTPHQVLEDLQTLSFPKVNILMGGKPFAEGSLVDIKGSVGCKIVRFLS